MGVNLNTEKLSALRKMLPRGYRKIIEREANCCAQSIYKTFKNECKDPELVERIINSCIKLVKVQNKESKRITKKIQTVTK